MDDRVRDNVLKLKKATNWTERNALAPIILKEIGFAHQASEVINLILDKTSNHSNWIFANNLARSMNEESVWQTIIFNLLRLTKKTNAPTWSFNNIHTICSEALVSPHNLKNILRAVLQDNNKSLIQKVIDNPSNNFSDRDIHSAIENNVDIMTGDDVKYFIKFYSSWMEIQFFLDKVKNDVTVNFVVENLVGTILGKGSMPYIKNFSFFDLEDIIKIYGVNNIRLAIYLSELISMGKRGPTTIPLFVKAVIDSKLFDNQKSRLYSEMYALDTTNPMLNKELYNLFKDPKYLPDAVKKIFLIKDKK